MSTFGRKFLQAIAGVGLSVLVIFGASSAGDASDLPNPRPPLLTMSGDGTFETTDQGSALAHTTGDLYWGNIHAPRVQTIEAELIPLDGSLPEPGVCEPADATMTLVRQFGPEIELVGSGDVCGEFVQLPFITTHAFTGRYEVISAGSKRLVGTDGFFEIRLGNDGSASTFAIDT